MNNENRVASSILMVDGDNFELCTLIRTTSIIVLNLIRLLAIFIMVVSIWRDEASNVLLLLKNLTVRLAMTNRILAFPVLVCSIFIVTENVRNFLRTGRLRFCSH